MTLQPDDPTQAQAWIRGTAPDQIVDFYIPRGNQGQIGPRGPIGPSLTVGEVLTVSGPPAPGTVGPQGLTGLKGDPGGWAASTVLATGTNLNDVITSGLYLNPQSNVAAGPSNSTNGGHLEVIASSGWVYQRYTPISEPRETYVRYRTSASVWSVWTSQNTTRVDQTAGRVIYIWDDVNNREQLIYGDTGWRNVNPSVDANFVPAGVGVQFRRIGNRVTCDVRGSFTAVPNPATQALICSIPVGFRGVNYCLYPSGVRGTSVISLGGPSNNIDLYMYSTLAIPAATAHIAQATWTTDEPWPTTLPGTAVGTIPNL